MAKPVVAIVGSETLLGRDLREVFEESRVPVEIKLIGALEDSSGLLTRKDAEVAYINPLETPSLVGARIVLLAGSPQSGRKALDLIAALGESPAVVDCTSLLDDQPNARLRAPMVEPTPFDAPAGVRHVIAQPASIALALFYGRLRGKYAIRRSVALVFEPASERGQHGLDELQQQTVSLLSLRGMPKRVYDAQVSFNLLPRFGSEAPEPLEEIEGRIDRNLASLFALVGTDTPMPSLRLVQAPVFHGYSISVWAEFDEDVNVQALSGALASAQVEIRGSSEEPPSNVGVAGQSGLTVGVIEADRNNPRAAWFWIVTDNLRMLAENAVLTVRSLLEETAGKGK